MYTFITYSSEGSTPKEVEARLRLQENVLRFLTVCKDENEIIAKIAKPAEEPEAAEETPEKSAEKPIEETVEAAE